MSESGKNLRVGLIGLGSMGRHHARVIRATEDPLLGPVVSFGMAGDAVNLLEDWAHRVPPLTQRDVRMMVRAPRASSSSSRDTATTGSPS